MHVTGEASGSPTGRRLIPRAIGPRVREALFESRAVAVLGPRQAGKTTLVRDLVHTRSPATYFTLDDTATRNAARSDPTGFIAQMGRYSIIDEVQRVPDLLLSLKERLDRDQRPGQFLLTGSANIQTHPPSGMLSLDASTMFICGLWHSARSSKVIETSLTRSSTGRGLPTPGRQIGWTSRRGSLQAVSPESSPGHQEPAPAPSRHTSTRLSVATYRRSPAPETQATLAGCCDSLPPDPHLC
jgi:hypothetical protein